MRTSARELSQPNMEKTRCAESAGNQDLEKQDSEDSPSNDPQKRRHSGKKRIPLFGSLPGLGGASQTEESNGVPSPQSSELMVLECRRKLTGRHGLERWRRERGWAWIGARSKKKVLARCCIVDASTNVQLGGFVAGEGGYGKTTVSKKSEGGVLDSSKNSARYSRRNRQDCKADRAARFHKKLRNLFKEETWSRRRG